VQIIMAGELLRNLPVRNSGNFSRMHRGRPVVSGGHDQLVNGEYKVSCMTTIVFSMMKVTAPQDYIPTHNTEPLQPVSQYNTSSRALDAFAALA
jgi:hypothetical protein